MSLKCLKNLGILFLWMGLIIEMAGGQELSHVNNQFIAEQGCPLGIVSVKTNFEVDSFGAPLACQIFIDYQNNSPKPISAVKFRIGYIDRQGNVRGVFHAPCAEKLLPGSNAACKWRGEKVDPRTTEVKIRVLAVKYADGSVWESVKMKDVAKAGSGQESNSGSGGTGLTQSKDAGGASSSSGQGRQPMQAEPGKPSRDY